MVRGKLLFFLWGILFPFVLQAGKAKLLPYPQKCIFTNGQFVFGKVRLETVALPEKWKIFITERGGIADQRTVRHITV